MGDNGGPSCNKRRTRKLSKNIVRLFGVEEVIGTPSCNGCDKLIAWNQKIMYAYYISEFYKIWTLRKRRDFSEQHLLCRPCYHWIKKYHTFDPADKLQYKRKRRRQFYLQEMKKAKVPKHEQWKTLNNDAQDARSQLCVEIPQVRLDNAKKKVLQCVTERERRMLLRDQNKLNDMAMTRYYEKRHDLDGIPVYKSYCRITVQTHAPGCRRIGFAVKDRGYKNTIPLTNSQVDALNKKECLSEGDLCFNVEMIPIHAEDCPGTCAETPMQLNVSCDTKFANFQSKWYNITGNFLWLESLILKKGMSDVIVDTYMLTWISEYLNKSKIPIKRFLYVTLLDVAKYLNKWEEKHDHDIDWVILPLRLCPSHQTQSHYFVTFVNIRTMNVWIYDSSKNYIPLKYKKNEIMRVMMHIYPKIVPHTNEPGPSKKKTHWTGKDDKGDEDLDIKWRFKTMNNCIQQEDEWSCGIHMISFITNFIRSTFKLDKVCPHPINVPAWRMHILSSVLWTTRSGRKIVGSLKCKNDIEAKFVRTEPGLKSTNPLSGRLKTKESTVL